MGARGGADGAAGAREVARARLVAQGLVPGFGRRAGLAQTVAWMGMVQAQDLRQAFWALGVRQPGSRASDVRAALNGGTLVRTWGARGTLMLLAPEDVAALLSVTADRMLTLGAARQRQLGISEQDIDALVPVAAARCKGGGATREELFEVFREAGQPTTGQRGIHLLFALSMRRVLLQGPLADGATHRQLFVPYGDWLGPHAGAEGMTPEEALQSVAVRYFRSHGPATERDLAWWLGVPLAPVRSALAAVAESQPATLAARHIAGATHWMDPDAAECLDTRGVPAPGARSLLALPGFDELLLGYRDRSATLSPIHADRVVPGGNGVFRRVLVAGGTAVGTWVAAGTRSKPTCEAEPFEGTLTPGQERAFAARAREHQAFLAG